MAFVMSSWNGFNSWDIHFFKRLYHSKVISLYTFKNKNQENYLAILWLIFYPFFVYFRVVKFYPYFNVMKPHELKLLSQYLQSAFLTLKTADEVFAFLRDLMTETEIIEFSQRLDIARRLGKWESYAHIQQVTGASSTTVARVGKFLHGKYGGYQLVLDRITT